VNQKNANVNKIDLRHASINTRHPCAMTLTTPCSLGAYSLTFIKTTHQCARSPKHSRERRQTDSTQHETSTRSYLLIPGFSARDKDRSYPFCPAVPRLGSLHLASLNLLHSPTQMLPAGFSLSRQSIYTETLCNRHHLTTEMALFGDSSSTDWAALAAACLPRLVRRTGVKLT
jgi:hypothetical protein